MSGPVETWSTSVVGPSCVIRPVMTSGIERWADTVCQRATFVTLSLANGKSEAWVSARTGHRSSQMINRYRRVSQSVAELNLGALSR
jgi:hypothetical protein